MGLNPGFDCTFPSVFGTGEQGVSPHVYRYHCSSKQDSLANGRDILAEMSAIHNDEEKLKTSNTKQYNYFYVSAEKSKK